MKTRLLILALVVSAPFLARAETYKIDPAHSHISFGVHHLLGMARGEFHKFSGTIEVDSQQPDHSAVNVSIQLASIDTKIRKRDDHLLGADFFNSAKFPEITFRSRSVKQISPITGDVVGDLTMHGVTHPLTLHVKLLTPPSDGAIPAHTRWSVTTDPIHRKDFGLMFSGTAEAISGIGQDVVPSIEIEAIRSN